MVEFDVSIDGDSNDVHSTAGNTNEAEDSSYSVSSGQGGSDDDEGDDDHEDEDEDEDDEDDGNANEFDDSAFVGNTVRIDSMTSEEIRALEFSSVDEAYDFYYKYGKCKGFSVRKSDDKKKNGPDGTKIITNKLFVCSKQGLRDKKHLCKLNRKRVHRRLTRSNCNARFRVTYKANKGKFVVSVFEETHNHELTPSRKKGCIFEFMHNFEQAVRNYRNNELVADFTSKFSEPVLTTQLKKIESHAAEIFTAQIFKDVKDEIMKAGELIVRQKKEIGDTKFYTLTKYCVDKYERTVIYDGVTFQCSCRMFDSKGLPCSHIFNVMKEEHVDRIHSSLILSRWTKDAKIAYLNMADVNGSIDSDSIELARFGAYCSVFTAFCKDVSKKEGVYGDIMEDLMNLRNKYCGVEDPIGTQKSDVRDPVPVKVKGAPKRKKNEAKAVRRCTKCNSPSHNARTCSEKKRNKSCNAENSVQTIYSEVPEDRCESSVQKKNKFSEQPKDRGESSFQNKKRRCEQPKDNIESSMPKQKKCSMQRQNRRANVSTPAQTDVTSTVGQLTPMYGFQPMMTYLHPIIQPTDAPHVPPIQPGYQLYGMNVGLLQQVINSADKKD
ncbi:hypothetical protein P8452_16166 [Trifolium repens]|nr:hypothetical protein P8452_16166 [Trifolium repens]